MADDTLATDDTKLKADAKPVAKPPVANYTSIAAATRGIEADPAIISDRARIAGLQKKVDEPIITKAPPAPAPSNPLQAFGEPAMWIAAIGSLTTRSHLISAVNSAKAVQESIKNQNEDEYKRAYAQWKLDTENAQKMAEREQKSLQNAVTMLNTDVRAADAAIRTHISEYKNQAVDQVYRTEGWEGVKRYLSDQKKTTAAMGTGATSFGEKYDPNLPNTPGKISDALYSDDPTKQAAGLESLVRQDTELANSKKGTVAERQATLAKSVNYQHIVQQLRSGDEAQIASARDTMKSLPELAYGGVKNVAPKTATPGSASWMNDQRYKDTEERMKADGTFAGPSSVQDRMIKEVKDAKADSVPPAVADMVADRVIAGDPSALSGFGRSPKLLAQLETALQTRMAEKGLTGADIVHAKIDLAAYMQGEKAFEAGGKLAPAIQSLNTVVGHLDVLSQAAEALAQNDITALNRIQNSFNSQLGSTGPITFDAVKNIVAPEIEKAITGGAGAVADRSDLKESLSRAYTPEQMKSVIKNYTALMGGQLASFEQTYARSRQLAGMPMNDFKDRFLTPEARVALTGGGNKGGQAERVAGGAQEGTKATSKSGKPIVFRNGHWEYE